MNDNLQRYLDLKREERELREAVIQTQNPAIEERRIRVALEREALLDMLLLRLPEDSYPREALPRIDLRRPLTFSARFPHTFLPI